MKYILLLISIWGFTTLNAQIKYNYYEIPDSLKKDADYVVWEHVKEFNIKKQGKAEEKERLAICIVDQYSKAYNSIYTLYDKNETVTKFYAEIYDARGELVKKLKKTDINDMSAVSSFSLFEDDRVLVADFIHNQYPYTLVFEYEKKVDGLLNYPGWYFQIQENTGVIKSELKISIPDSLPLRYKEFNLNKGLKITEEKGFKTYIWKEEFLKPVENPELLPPVNYYEPMVYLAPTYFVEGGIYGTMDSWQSFGKWCWDLNKNRDLLPEETKSKINEFVKSTSSEREKIKMLYKYMQDKTRYVSVQLGIGGYQTFPAEYVDTKGYGDCKALSNYMYSLLKEVGIKSYYTLVKAGRNRNDINIDFPSNQFNHVILCVPQQKDTIWLECTSQQQPFNFLGSFTDDRHALLITENGGKLVKTPKYGKDINAQYRKIDIKLDNDGHADVKVLTLFKGLQYENREGWKEQSAKEQKDALKKAYPVSGTEINDYKFTEIKNEIPEIIEELDLVIMRLASTSGKRMFLKLNLFNQSDYVPKKEERKIPFQLKYEFTDIDSVQIEIPDGYEIENMPRPINLQTKFGSYSSEIQQIENKILYIRKHISEKGIYPATDYSSYFEYRKEIKKTDAAKLVLVKKE